MTTTYGFKPNHDIPDWEALANSPNAHAAGGCLAYDQRTGLDRHPLIYQYVSATIFNAYNPITDDWLFIGSPGMGTFGAGAGAVFVASAGPNGTITTGATSTSVVLSTALPAAVGINQLANRGDGVPFKVRIIDNAGGASGKTEEAYIIANTAGTTPTLTLSKTLGSSTPLSFTPTSGSRYEILSGRVFLMATAAAIWKYYDIATNSFSAALTTTNLSTPATDTWLGVLDELYTPPGQAAGAGFFGNLIATASGATSLTGTGAGADANLAANEYANFQIRIIEDTGTPTAVGQRRKISSHTAAAPTVYTISSAWSVTPSATAKYVIEQIGDVIAFTGSATALSHTYAAGGFRADGAWSTGSTSGAASLQIPNRQANTATGITACIAYAITPDAAKATRRSGLYMIRGGAVATIDCLDIAALSWSSGIGGADITYGNKGGETFTTGTCGVYDALGTYKDASAALGNTGASEPGLYWYLNQSAGRFRRFDVKHRTLLPWANYRQGQGAAAVGERMAMSWAYDSGSTNYGSYVHFLGSSQAQLTRALAPL